MNSYDHLKEAFASIANAFKSLGKTYQCLLKEICDGFDKLGRALLQSSIASRLRGLSKNWTSIKKNRYIRKERRNFYTARYQLKHNKAFHRKMLRR